MGEAEERGDGLSVAREGDSVGQMRCEPFVAGVLLAGLGIAWATGVFKVKTKDGIIVLEDLPDKAEVLVDGEKVTVKFPDGGGPAEIAGGAEDGAEMGAFSFLQQPQRLANLTTALAEYLRFGLEAGMIEQT